MSDKNSIIAVAAALAAGATLGATFGTLLMKKNEEDKSGRSRGTSAPGPVTGRRYLIGGNWKCNGLLETNAERVDMMNDAGSIPPNVDVVVCVPFVHIPMVLANLRQDIEVGAQNCGNNIADGAYTGEVGVHQLIDLGCTWVIIGHSERRVGFGMPGEPHLLCAEKCQVALENGLKIMFCIGEKKEERVSGITMDVCAQQLKPLAKIIPHDQWADVALVYEPVWAIGTGLTATSEMAQETHASIRKWIADNVSSDVANSIRILYGGSMNGSNAKALLAQPDIDGGLIGGASLKADFFNVINAVPE